jgi:ATP-binding cassette, subfamily B, bacterial
LQVLCIVTLVAFDTLFPLSTKFLIDLAITPHDGRVLVLLIIGLALLYILSSFGSLASDYLISAVAARVLNDLRLKMFSHLQNLPASYYSHVQVGEIITYFNTDLTAIEYALTYSIIPGIQYVLQLLISVGVLFMLDVPLAIITIIILPFTAILPKRYADQATALTFQRRDKEAGISNTVQENLQANAVTRIFGLSSSSIAAFSKQLKPYAEIATKSAFVGWLVNRTTNIGQYLIQLLVIGMGGYLVFLGKLSIGSLVGFTTLLISVGYAVSLVSVAFAGLIPAVASLERVEGLLNEKILISDNLEVPLQRFSEQISFDQVTFGYNSPIEKPILNHLNFSIPCGQSIAIIGRSGSGKSTLLNLLMRFYDPQEGRILLDGKDIQRASLTSLRSQMGVVFQDTFLFNTTLRENIRMGKIGATDAEVEEAAKAAEVHDAIMSLPAQYDTLAGEQGKSLSGGQRQRIALARAIIRHPAILLLDEATSALDPQTEMLIYDTLKDLRRTCTILSVTHRLKPIADMDQILVMDHGQVAELGTHEDLMIRNGLYFQMATQQSGFTISSDGQNAEITPTRLRSIPLFEGLEDAVLTQLADLFVPEQYDSGQTVICQGEMGNKFYIIVRGKMSVTILSPEQKLTQMTPMQDGDYFGEIALLEEGRRTATICAILPSLLLSLERRHFLNVLKNYPAIRETIEQSARNRRSASAAG